MYDFTVMSWIQYLNYWLFSPEIRHLPPIFLDKKVEISKHDQIDPTSTIKILTKKQKWKNKNFKYVAYMHCFKDHINNRKYFLHFIRLLLPPKSLILPNLGGHPYRYISTGTNIHVLHVGTYTHSSITLNQRWGERYLYNKKN